METKHDLSSRLILKKLERIQLNKVLSIDELKAFSYQFI